jgi:hypothetical protein
MEALSSRCPSYSRTRKLRVCLTAAIHVQPGLVEITNGVFSWNESGRKDVTTKESNYDASAVTEADEKSKVDKDAFEADVSHDAVGDVQVPQFKADKPVLRVSFAIRVWKQRSTRAHLPSTHYPFTAPQ